MRQRARAAAGRIGGAETGAGPTHEYACHEGNYALRNMLTGAAAEAAGR